MFRITQRSMADSTYLNLQASLARSSRLQEQLSSGKAVAKPSDSPSGANDIMTLRAQRSATDQNIRNASNGVSWLNTTDNALQLAAANLRRARDLTVQGGNSSVSQSGRDALAAELSGIRDSMLELANTQYLGRPVFGGTVSTGVAFDATGTYVGDGGTVQRRVGDNAVVRVDTDGASAFGSGATSVFAALDTVIADLRAGNTSGGHLNALDTSLNQLLGAVADVGSRTNRIENLRLRADDLAITLRSAQSQIEDIDLPGTILELQLQSTAYQAALGATARVIQPSLLDFLR